jgi:hypothetical protein
LPSSRILDHRIHLPVKDNRVGHSAGSTELGRYEVPARARALRKGGRRAAALSWGRNRSHVGDQSDHPCGETATHAGPAISQLSPVGPERKRLRKGGGQAEAIRERRSF